MDLARLAAEAQAGNASARSALQAQLRALLDGEGAEEDERRSAAA